MNSELERAELDFLSEFVKSASPIQITKICISALRSGDWNDYFLSLVYGVKLKQYLDTVPYLTDPDRKNMVRLVSDMSGKDAKRLFESVSRGTLRGEDLETLSAEIRTDLTKTLGVVQRTFTEIIRKRSDEKDQSAIRKIRDGLGIE